MMYSNGCSRLLLLALAILLVSPAFATVKVGNGGDVLDSFLDQLRWTLVKVIRNPRPDKPVGQQCYGLERLNPAQQELCAEFVQAALESLFKLNTGPKPTPFQLVQQPIETTDPDGQPRRVAAGTECGPAGAILFHYDNVRSFEPRELYHVLVHEFGHKVSFRNRPCVTDNEAIGAFGTAGGGRKLIDAFAEALTREAIERGLIGEILGIDDFFAVSWTSASPGPDTKVLLRTERVVLDKGVFDRFQAGVGVLPDGPNLELSNSRLEPGVRYIPVLKIAENQGCRKTEDDRVRGSELSVLKVFDPLPDGTTPAAEVLVNEVFPGVNPICEEGPRDFVAPFDTSYGSYSFTLRYVGTKAAVDRKFLKRIVQPLRFLLEN